ncbi:AlpA family phage regulatory protein [Pseudomonas sp. GM21]|uniref:AlpA family phage regulatory protein n=1 Tax=Pseudomonas sp. GM21 TaxID=1144325 RepID=UPI000A2F74D7
MIRPKALATLLAISDVTLWRLSKRPDFPQKIQISPRTVAYRRSDVDAWLDSKASTPVAAKAAACQ